MWTHENVSMCVNTPIMQLAQLNAVRFHCGTSFSINIWEANEENKKTNKYKEGGVQKFYFFAKTMGLPSLRRSHDINNEDNKRKKNF